MSAWVTWLATVASLALVGHAVRPCVPPEARWILAAVLAALVPPAPWPREEERNG